MFLMYRRGDGVMEFDLLSMIRASARLPEKENNSLKMSGTRLLSDHIETGKCQPMVTP